ncbi:MAG: hypothetical protein ACI4II_00760, partial [Acutalibacteraceae bacterium]
YSLTRCDFSLFRIFPTLKVTSILVAVCACQGCEPLTDCFIYFLLGAFCIATCSSLWYIFLFLCKCRFAVNIYGSYFPDPM